MTQFPTRDFVDGMPALMAGGANVIMQLALPAVGYGVAESRVTSGQATRHPVKRARTTFTYLSVAMFGDDNDRSLFRSAVNGQHAQVRSNADSKVQYNAFDPELQLWVAACLYWGSEDVYQRLHGPVPAEHADAFYQYGARFGTTLQVRPEMWPADRAAFEVYWTEMQQRMQIDDTVRDYLDGLVKLGNIPAPLRRLFAGFNKFVTVGYLPPPFREQMRYEWTAHDQARFDRLLRMIALVHNRMPPAVRVFPFNFFLWDMRRRVRRGRPLV
ncbi:oxygenase MpaB family protein [Jatrophihabitans sp.]|uniref:oxygenase MpaB family protein n=1 Tax=Jatrophihabitans sp. TaxID=1932789 RepID=UPI0030C76EF8|nr:hypothetical protein [Jatrophihabitans sp.]